MSADRPDFVRQSICATCLSQGRKLFPPPSAILSYGLNVCERDRVCWECRHFVMKMVAFKTRALKAQAMLTNLLNGKLSKVGTLSSLSKSTGLFLHIPNTPDFSRKEKTVGMELVETEAEEISDEASCDKVDDELPSDEWQEEENLDIKSNENKKKKRKPRDFSKIQFPYTEKKMTEEEMWQWRERKKSTHYYLTGIPIFRCEKCIEPFDTEKSFNAHMETHSEAFGDVSCPICEQRCFDETTAAVHKETHYSLLSCRHCSHEWDEANAMREHGRDVHGVPVGAWRCHLCPHECTTRYKLGRHVGAHRVAPCAECGEQVRVENMWRHLTLHRSVEMLQCEVCGGKYRGKMRLVRHMRARHKATLGKDAYCEHCAIQFENIDLYRSHLGTCKRAADQNPRYICNDCGRGFHFKVDLSLHIETMHYLKMYYCDVCGKDFETRSGLRNHARFKHEGVPRPRDKVCDYCGKTFMTEAILKEHINTHTGTRPLVCKLCDATFRHKGALYHHGRYKHKMKKKANQ